MQHGSFVLRIASSSASMRQSLGSEISPKTIALFDPKEREASMMSNIARLEWLRFYYFQMKISIVYDE
jgi:hypothetical protein